MKTKRIIVLLAGMLCLASCERDKLITPEIRATLDHFVESEEDGSKVVLFHNEEWLKWEEGDEVTIYSVNGSNKYVDDEQFVYVDGDGNRMAYLHAKNSGITSGDKYYAVYPEGIKHSYSSGNNLGVNDLKVDLMNEHAYRPFDNPYADSSFGIGAIPMVSYNGTDNIDNINFHMVAGVMRLQFWSEDAAEYTLQEMRLESINLPSDGVDDDHSSQVRALSGEFDVRRLMFVNPYLYSKFVAPGSDASKVKYTFDGNLRFGGASQKLWTFYVPLPAQGTDKDQTITYKLYLTLKLGSTSGDRYLMKGIKVDIHRQNITMMPAIGFEMSDLSESDSWLSAAGVDLGFVGSGTKERPFRIYTGEEMVKLRDIFNNAASTSTTPKVNGRDVDANTYFEVVRSDIQLVSSSQRTAMIESGTISANDKQVVVWNTGINNFTGKMQFKSSSAQYGGLINTSGHPLFESIGPNGEVERMQIRGEINYTSTAVFSPMCNKNFGRMVDCHVKCNITANVAGARGIAGLCVRNFGTIIGGANEAPLTTVGSVSGCVYENFGEVQGSFSLSSAIPVGANIAGICMYNYGRMRYCQVESNVDPQSSGNWGVIAFYNFGDTTLNPGDGIGSQTYNGTIERCISSGSVVFSTTGSIGGIVHTNSGIVKDCSNSVTLRGASNNIGGIVAIMYGGEVYNCDTEGNHWIDGTGGSLLGYTADNAGGIVGYLVAGTISNCYNHCRVDGATNSGGIVGDFDDGAVIQNSWSAYGHNFIGSNSATGTVGDFCFSAHLDDYNIGCNTLDTLSGVRYHIHQMQSAQDAAYGSANGGNSLTQQHMGIALNWWVSQHPTASDGGAYYTWSPTGGDNMPRLVMPTDPSKGRAATPKMGKPRRVAADGILKPSLERRFRQRSGR